MQPWLGASLCPPWCLGQQQGHSLHPGMALWGLCLQTQEKEQIYKYENFPHAGGTWTGSLHGGNCPALGMSMGTSTIWILGLKWQRISLTFFVLNFVYVQTKLPASEHVLQVSVKGRAKSWEIFRVLGKGSEGVRLPQELSISISGWSGWMSE